MMSPSAELCVLLDVLQLSPLPSIPDPRQSPLKVKELKLEVPEFNCCTINSHLATTRYHSNHATILCCHNIFFIIDSKPINASVHKCTHTLLGAQLNVIQSCKLILSFALRFSSHSLMSLVFFEF